ncbi:LysR family transcriptional regulator [Epibacterium sp. SM1979]|uniref:LysR family transcriptional regulator n=1 Tax=Tritonibacter litoralis TaxID=2662264 RepID=A0A843YEV7_9RHOB|nr:LysR family transcriptional regulator [Tritonibacter litoralis]MQQ07994.1 LysR family transcriptional regulator [Tritonibacter litoralis]
MERPEPDIWRDLAVLLAVGEAQSAFAAADALGLSQTDVAQRIDMLEARIGSVLVNRTGPNWVLTTKGKDLAHRARSIADLVQRGSRPTLRGSSRPIVLSCPELFFEHLLLPVWYRIHREIPSQPMKLRNAVSVLDQSTKGNDLTLCLGKGPRKPGVEGHEVGQVTFRLFVHKRLLNSVTDVPPCHFTVDNPQLAVPDLVWPELGQTRRVSCQNLAMVAAAVKSGQGIGLLPDFVAHQDRALVPLAGAELPPFGLWILSQPGRSDTGRIGALRSLLEREIVPFLTAHSVSRH